MAQILIIDDDPEMCEMLLDLIARMGYDAACRNTLDGGLNEVLSKPYDVVLLDVHLPDGSGLDIIPKIRATRSVPDIIIITGFGDADGAETAIKYGAWDYIQKTDSSQKILLPLQRVLQYRDQLKKDQKSPVALNLDGIIGNSSRMKACFDLLAQAANSDINVFWGIRLAPVIPIFCGSFRIQGRPHRHLDPLRLSREEYLASYRQRSYSLELGQ